MGVLPWKSSKPYGWNVVRHKKTVHEILKGQKAMLTEAGRAWRRPLVRDETGLKGTHYWNLDKRDYYYIIKKHI